MFLAARAGQVFLALLCCLLHVKCMHAPLRVACANACAGLAMSKDVVTGVNYVKAGSDPPLRPDSEYPDWLWDIMKPREALFSLQRKLGPERDISTISLEEVCTAVGQRPQHADSLGSWQREQRPEPNRTGLLGRSRALQLQALVRVFI